IHICFLSGLTLAPLFVKINPNVNVVLTACLTTDQSISNVLMKYAQEMISNKHAMRFPFVGSAMLLLLFLLFKIFSKDLVNAVLSCYFFVLGIVAISATLPPAIKRFLPEHWNNDLIIWRAPYFDCMLYSLSDLFSLRSVWCQINLG
ncbi:hypothetical protein GW17_00012825, partial [Ensete ventricosum]